LSALFRGEARDVALDDWDWQDAEAELKRAIELATGYAVCPPSGMLNFEFPGPPNPSRTNSSQHGAPRLTCSGFGQKITNLRDSTKRLFGRSGA
jgi:hypothetical protein